MRFLTHTNPHTHTRAHADTAKPTPSPTQLNHCQHSSSLGSVLPTAGAQWGKESGPPAPKVEATPNTLTIPVVLYGLLQGDFFGSTFSLRNTRVTPTQDLEAGVQVHAAPPLATESSTNPSPSPGRGRTGRFFAAASHFLETGSLQGAGGAGGDGAIHVASA